MLYSFGFAAFLFTALPAETAGPTIRRASPHFYLFVFATAVLGAALSWPFDRALYGLSVVVTLAHIVTAGWVLSQFLNISR